MLRVENPKTIIGNIGALTPFLDEINNIDPIIKRLYILLPWILPYKSFQSLLNPEATVVASSGRDVPIATIDRPIISLFSPKIWENEMIELTKK